MKTIAIDEISTRRSELLDDLAHGETIAITDCGREIATLSPRRNEDRGAQPPGDDASYRMAELAAQSTDEGAPLSNTEMDRRTTDEHFRIAGFNPMLC